MVSQNCRIHKSPHSHPMQFITTKSIAPTKSRSNSRSQILQRSRIHILLVWFLLHSSRYSFSLPPLISGMFTPLWYIQTFAVQLGVNKSSAFWLLAIINAASLPGRVLPGFYADYVGTFNVLTPCALITGILLFSWYAISSPVGIYIFAALYGFFQGAMISLQAASNASICKDLREIGTMMGMSSAVCSIAYSPF
jgi:predicted MFS family arabinose efflux permease